MARPRSTVARARALDAALDVLNDVGVEGATIEEIALRSGVAKSTLYRHFDSRERLLAEAVKSLVVEAPTPNTGSLDNDLETIFDRYDDTEDSRRMNALFPLLLDASRRDAGMRSVLDALLSERQRPLRTVIQLAQGRGDVDPDLDLDVALAMLIGPLTYRRMVQDLEITSDFIARILPAGIAALRSTVPSPT